MPLIMREFLRRWWPTLKLIFICVVLVGIGWHLATLLEHDELDWREELANSDSGGLAICGLLYLVALGFPAALWICSLRVCGERLAVAPGVRAYFLSHLGKYAPGKGLPLVMRTTMATTAGCRPSLAALTAIYETLTTMAAGGLVAALLLVTMGGKEHFLWTALGLLVFACVPILPGVFNRVVARLSRRFARPGTAEIPPLPARLLPFGLALTSLSWFCMGASLEVLLLTMGAIEEPSLSGWLRMTSYVAVSYVAGFIVSTPGGLGVREFLLKEMLEPALGSRAVIVALVLRLVWTLAEIAIGAVLWWCPRRGRSPELKDETDAVSGHSGL